MAALPPTLIAAPPRKKPKLDPVTVIQDSVDFFSLAVFSALREVRDVSLHDIALSERADEARMASELAQRSKGKPSAADAAAAAAQQNLSAEEEAARDLALAQRLSSDVLVAHDKIVEAIAALPFANSTLFGELAEVSKLQGEIDELDREIAESKAEGVALLEQVKEEVKLQAKKLIES
jgi:hypothetical protein